MKKVKILTIVLMVIATLIGISYSVFGGNDNRTQLEIGENQSTQDLGYGDMLSKYNNVYCIEHGQSMNKVRRYNIKTKIVIKGNIAEIYTNKNGSYELEETVIHEANNVMAAILTDGSVDGKEGIVSGNEYSYGYKVNYRYSDAQHGLYQYLSTWVDAINGSKYGFEGANRALTGDAATIASAVIAQAQAKAEEYCYNLTLYLLYRPVNYYQSLIVTDPEDPTPFDINVPVTKLWLDGENKYNTRPQDIKVRLLANGVICKNGDGTEKVATLNKENGWKYTFEGLDVYDENDQKIQYSVEEVNVSEKYTPIISGDMNVGYTITNREKTELKVIKNWKDEDNLDDLRPTEIIVKLLMNESVYKNEDGTDKIVTLKESEGWTASFTDLYRYDLNGNEIKYTVQEEVVTGYDEPQYDKTISEDGTIIYTVTNTHKPNYNGYKEISGKVWLDKLSGKSNELNGKFDSEEKGLGGIKVTLKDVNGNQFDVTSTTTTKEDGTYIIKVNYDNSQNVYKVYENSEIVAEKLKTAYVEFEYDAIKYTTVSTAQTGADTSKAIEDETTRANIDNTYSKVTSSTIHPNDRIDNYITAITKDVISFETYTDTETSKRDEVIKYCNGDGTCKHTNPNNAWGDIVIGQYNCSDCKKEGHTLKTFKVDVETIQNVNLGLFEREQPDVALTTDLSKVEVTMNGQKYTYKYGVKSDETKDVGLKTQFETKYTYEYKRPVNPSDISYIQEEANSNAMSVLVKYQIKIANLSTTLPIVVHNIANYFDSRYTLNATDWTTTALSEFNKSINNGDLNITVQPQTSSAPIEVTYTVSIEALKDLLNKNATLNHASEIEAYSTVYGEKTLYAEQRTNGRTGNAYAGYDYDSHPGNAEIFINSEGRLDATNFEDDTDIAPSFVLCKDDPKTLSGTIFEDTDVNTDDAQRLGDGKYDSSKEKVVKNVKVELYNLDGTIAKLYQDPLSTESKDAVTYSDEKGNYILKGVVTGEYFLKFTYGDDTTELVNGPTTIDGITAINARNYKSTIITSPKLQEMLKLNYTDEGFDKNWHINIEDNHSVAVDNMIDRLEIQDLQYNNFQSKENMTSYTKPFKTQVEFDADGEGESDKDGEIGISNVLDKLDFGIIERPREDLFVEKTITYMKVVLANGQTLIDGDPRTQTLNFAKAMGFKQDIKSGEAARKAQAKRLLIEMDVELIQGATIELKYEVKVTNNNELDYDYGNVTDYSDIKGVVTAGVNDQYITKSNLANYYYFGNASGLNEMKTTIEFADYLSNDITYEEDSTKWIPLDAKTELYDNGLLSDTTFTAIKDSKYKVFTNPEKSITLSRNASWTQDMLVRKSLANQEENVYNNSLEILKIDGKTARTIQEADKNGKQIEKSYKPGNYVPASANGEQDDDLVEVIITPPTGISEYAITYLITGAIGLIASAAIIIFIKKKGLTK